MSRTATMPPAAPSASQFLSFGGTHTMFPAPSPRIQTPLEHPAPSESCSNQWPVSASTAPEQAVLDIEPVAFLDLPTDIHIEVANWLPWRAQWSLKRTSRYFHSVPELAAPVSFFQQRHRGKAYQRDLLHALCAANVVRRGYEPCYACQRFRWKSSFDVDQFQRGYLWCNGGDRSARYGPPPAAASPAAADQIPNEGVFQQGKFCIECGLKAGKYVEGQTIEIVHDWSDFQGDRQRVVIAADGTTQGGDPRTANVMISEEGMEDLERKFSECGCLGCDGRVCGKF